MMDDIANPVNPAPAAPAEPVAPVTPTPAPTPQPTNIDDIKMPGESVPTDTNPAPAA